MIVYIDSNYICHADNATDRRPFEVPPLDGTCSMMVETYRFIPHGESWTRADGVEFRGEALMAAADPKPFEIAQRQYEIDMAAAADMQAALNILGVTE